MPIAPLTFLYGEYVPQCDHMIDKHYEGYCTLQYMASGIVDLTIAGKRTILRGSHFWSAYPGPRITFHAGEQTRFWVHRYMAFRGPLVDQWQADGLFPVPPQPATAKEQYARRFDQLLAFASQTNRRALLRATHILEGILLDLADARAGEKLQQQEADAAPAEKWIDRATGLLTPFIPGGTPDYAKIAQGMGMSESTFRRRFRTLAGVSPHTYLLHARIGSARRMLVHTDEPIKLIASRLGYNDVYFFSRQFRLITGVPPAIYRRSRQG